jgi:hypothetical protein
MSKIYAQKDVAEKIAAKLNKKGGEKHEVHQVDGGFQVLTEAQANAMLEQLTNPNLEAGGDAAEAHANASASTAKPADDLVKVKVPGKITKMYVITPNIDGSKRDSRWFELKRVKSATAVDGGMVEMILSRKALLSRGLKALSETAEVVAA